MLFACFEMAFFIAASQSTTHLPTYRVFISRTSYFLVVKEVTISGYEVADTKLVKLDNGSYRSFILLEYLLGTSLDK